MIEPPKKIEGPKSRLVNIAILGGTGKEGAGLATRWALAGHSIIIGSRDAERARTKATELREVTHKLPIVGHTNAEAAGLGDVIVIALPAGGLASTLPEVSSACRGKVVVSTVVPLTFGGPRLFTPPPVGSSAEEVQALLPEANVVAAFHHIAAHELSDADEPINCDLLLCGQDPDAKETVAELGRSVGLRPIDVGPLSNAGPLEGITAVLATINRRYKIKDAGIRITGF
jgi:NADPH-dependent F420 reductase